MEFTLYNYYRSSASYRVRIALEIKGIAYDYKIVSLITDGGQQFSEEYKKINPLSQVPSLAHRGNIITQSMAIIDYLDHFQPTPALFPRDPLARAKVIQLCEVINSGIQPLQNQSVTKELEKNFGFDEQASKRWRVYWIERGLASLEKMLEGVSGKFSFGDTVTAVDCFLAPQVFSSERFGVDVKKFRLISAIHDRLMAVPAVQAAHPSKQPDAV